MALHIFHYRPDDIFFKTKKTEMDTLACITHKEKRWNPGKRRLKNQQNNGIFVLHRIIRGSFSFSVWFCFHVWGEKWGRVYVLWQSKAALIAQLYQSDYRDMELADITTRVVDKYIQTLQKTPSVSRKNRKATDRICHELNDWKSSNFYGVLLSKLFVGNWLKKLLTM